MKKYYKLMVIAIISIFLVGCGCMKKTAKGAVEDFLNQYKSLSSNVISDMDEVVGKESITDHQKEVYRDALKRQYKDIKYEIVKEDYSGDTALVETKITVYDFYKVQKEANEHMTNNSDDFKDESGNFSNELFMDYKLDKMKSAKDTVDYTITFTVVKDDNGNYKVADLSQENLEKIHGIYNYDNE